MTEFSPGDAEINVKVWLVTADVCVSECPLEGGLLMTLNKAMKGTVTAWFTQVTFPGMTWKQFKQIFMFWKRMLPL